MLYKQVQLSLSAFALVALAACSSAPAQPRISVTVTGQTEATFTSTEPLIYTHSSPEKAPTTIYASSDAGDYVFSIDISNPLKPGIYTHDTDVSKEQVFNTVLYVCADEPSCNGVASSLDGSLTITRADNVTKGELTVNLRGLDDSDYGEATATFTVPPARVVL